MRIVVVGASGWLGETILDALDALPEHTVVAGVRDLARTPRLQLRRGPAVELDLARARTLREAVRGADLVVNCAGDVRERRSLEEYRETYVLGTRMLLEAMLGEHVGNFLQLSCGMVYGFDLPPQAIPETWPLRPEFPLPQALREREAVVAEFATLHHVRAVLVRPGWTLGPNDRSWLQDMALHHVAGIVPLVEQGRARFSGLDVRDAGRAVAHLVESWERASGTYHVAGFTASWRDVVTALEASLRQRSLVLPLPRGVAQGIARAGERVVAPDGHAPLTEFRVRMLGSHALLDDARLRALGWEPRFSLRDAVEGFVQPVG